MGKGVRRVRGSGREQRTRMLQGKGKVRDGVRRRWRGQRRKSKSAFGNTSQRTLRLLRALPPRNTEDERAVWRFGTRYSIPHRRVPPLLRRESEAIGLESGRRRRSASVVGTGNRPVNRSIIPTSHSSPGSLQLQHNHPSSQVSNALLPRRHVPRPRCFPPPR